MSGLRTGISELCIVARSVWRNVVLFALMLLAAAALLRIAECCPGLTFGQLLVKALYMARLEGALDGCANTALPAVLHGILRVTPRPIAGTLAEDT